MSDKVVVCLLCNRRFERDENGAADFLNHSCKTKGVERHPSGHTPKGAA
jgi:hypothetical protein